MTSLPDENSEKYFKDSMKWTHCPICKVKEFDSTLKWNKYNRDSHVRACIKLKRLEQIETKKPLTGLSKDIPSPKIQDTSSSKLFVSSICQFKKKNNHTNKAY
jgi:hypothetical protein